MNPGKDFNQNINQLIELLKKIVTHIPNQPASDPSFFTKQEKDASIHVNLCFFNMFPLGAEDMDELEEIYDQYLSQEEKIGETENHLTPADMEFLRRNGIRF